MPPLTTDQALRTVNRLYLQLSSRRPEIDRFQRYYDGQQPLAYATDAWKKEHATRYRNFSDNWCGVVGGAAATRTEVSGIRLGDDLDGSLDPVEKQLWWDWDVNEMPLQSAQGFLTSAIARRSAVIVWGDDDDEPVVSWEDPSQVIVDYEPGTRSTGAGRYALKAWIDGDREYATLYTADQVWKFQRSAALSISTDGQATGVTGSGLYVVGQWGAPITDQGSWEPRPVEETGDDSWPLSNPLGELNVREFSHKPQLRGQALSRIDGTVAMQDAINMLWAYLFVAADYASMPARVVMGQEPPKLPILDENGQKIGEKPVEIEQLSRGRMLWLTGQTTKIDSWEPATLSVFTDVINVAVKHIASQTRTPIHYIVGDLGNVNGETLTATETPLADDVRDDHKFYRAPLRGVFRLMALVRGEQAVADACRTATILWRNPETRSDAQLADAALKDRQIGFPLEWIAENRYNMPQADVGRLMRMVAEDPAGAGMLNRALDGIPPTSTADGMPGDQPDGGS